jgi:hypothetical protein
MFMTIQHVLFRKMFPVGVPPLADHRPHPAGRKVFARNLGEPRAAGLPLVGRAATRTFARSTRVTDCIQQLFIILAHPPQNNAYLTSQRTVQINLHLWTAVEPRRFTVTRFAVALTTTTPNRPACDRLSPRLCTKCIVVQTLDRLEPERQPPAAKRPAQRATCDARVATV